MMVSWRKIKFDFELDSCIVLPSTSNYGIVRTLLVFIKYCILSILYGMESLTLYEYREQ